MTGGTTNPKPKAVHKPTASRFASDLVLAPSRILFIQGRLLGVIGLGMMLRRIVLSVVDVTGGIAIASIEISPPELLIGLSITVAGLIISHGAAKMLNLESFGWSMIAALVGFAPPCGGLIAFFRLLDPRVRAGFVAAASENEEEREFDVTTPQTPQDKAIEKKKRRKR